MPFDYFGIFRRIWAWKNQTLILLAISTVNSEKPAHGFVQNLTGNGCCRFPKKYQRCL